jgi:hypothetical protein
LAGFAAHGARFCQVIRDRLAQRSVARGMTIAEQLATPTVFVVHPTALRWFATLGFN